LSPPSISAVFVVRDAASTIASMVVVADRVLRSLAADYELLVVDAGSRDHTAAILRELAPRYRGLRVVDCPGDRGYGAALRRGLAAASKDLIVYAPGDARYDPRDFARLLEVLAPDVDVVAGFPAGRREGLAARTRRGLVRRMFRLPVRRIDGDCRLLRRRVLDRVRLEEDGELVSLELAAKVQQAGYRVAEAPVSYCERVEPRSSLPWLVHTARGGARLWWRLQWRGEFRRALAEQDAVAQLIGGPPAVAPEARHQGAGSA